MNAIILQAYALTFLGINYLYGGKNPLVGFDCSGLVSEILKANQVIGNQETLGSQDLFNRFQQTGSWNVLKAGSLVFYGTDSTHIDHVAMLIDQETIIEAASGDHTTTSLQIAQQQGAFVKLRQYKYRNDLIAVIRPKYTWDISP